MDLTKKPSIKNLLKKYNAKPEKRLGQHFILSKKALVLMTAAAEIKKNETIIEIGPGFGALTRELAETEAKIITVEKDPLMAEILKETLSGYKNVKIINADARRLPFLKTGIKKYKIVANLPFNAATFLIREWLESKNYPELMVLMIQKEVARRIVASSPHSRVSVGTRPPHSNLLGISVQFYADVKIIGYISKESFWPKPKVDAAIIKIVPKKVTLFRRSLEKQQFFEIVKAGFSQPRKQLLGNLSKKLKLPREKLISIFKNLDISTTARAENLSLRQWLLLANNLFSFITPDLIHKQAIK